MGKNHLAFAFSFFILLASACTHNKLKELVIYKTTYTYSDSKCDSVVSVSEHYYFNKDSAVLKYINHDDGYFYLAENEKKNNILNRKFFTTDSSFLYSSISQLNDDGLETKTEFYDTSDNITYTIIRNYKKNSKLIQKEQSVFSNGSLRELIYEYDENDNLLKQSKVNNRDSVVTEYHQITYDASDRIIHDTIYYPETRKIVENKYLNDKLFYKIEKFEKKKKTNF